MHISEYLEYSAKEPMVRLRKLFNNGENIYQSVPETIAAEDAVSDILYLRYVFENAYSGFSYYDKSLFDHAFDQIIQSLRDGREIAPDQLIDVICSKLSFISDGHLALTTPSYGGGFYQRLQTYVSDICVHKIGNSYYDARTGERVTFESPVRTFPTIEDGAANGYLIGVRSKSQVKEIPVKLGAAEVLLPLHRIRSKEPAEETLFNEHYEKDIAIINCSSFVGDSETDMEKLYEVGEKCRSYRHVVWDLSNNLGGNSEFPKHFLSGLYGAVDDSVKGFELRSSLVHAKETGEIKEIPYCLAKTEHEPKENENLFCGDLHVIINDRVASSTELALYWAASCPRVTFYGCNSLGIGHFGDLCIYYLPHSKAVLWCPQKIFDTGIQETAGFEPDYWIDSPDVVSRVLDRIAGLQES